jgi:hypothetical protein
LHQRKTRISSRGALFFLIYFPVGFAASFATSTASQVFPANLSAEEHAYVVNEYVGHKVEGLNMATFQTAVAKVFATLCFRPETARTMSGRAVFATARALLALLPNPPCICLFKNCGSFCFVFNR